MTNRAILLTRAKEMRNNPTLPEKRLWNILRNSQVSGYKFRRQSVIEHRIVDFLCPAKKLIIEVDGDTHDLDKDIKMDQKLLMEQKYATLRFTNQQVMENLDGVYDIVLDKLMTLPDRWPTTPNPSSKEEGSFEADISPTKEPESFEADRSPSTEARSFGEFQTPSKDRGVLRNE